MGVRSEASPHDVIGVGIAFTVGGLYFILGAAGYVPMPEANGPSFIVVGAGLAFLFAGLTCVVRARTAINQMDGSLPNDAPTWAKVSYRVFAIAAAGALATIGTWLAIGGGPRAFSVSGFVEMHTAGETLGRTVFALGAVIAWIYVIAAAIAAARILFNRGG